MCTSVRSRLWILCRTKDREENPRLQLNYPPTAATSQGHRSRKTGRNRINLSLLLSPSPFLPKRWRDTAEHSKAHHKSHRLLKFPSWALQALHSYVFTSLCCTKKYTLNNEGSKFKGFQDKTCSWAQAEFPPSFQPASTIKYSGSSYGSSES